MWLQVFVDGMEPVRKPLERMFEDSASEKSVRAQPSLLSKSTNTTQMCLYIEDHNRTVSSLTFSDVLFYICPLLNLTKMNSKLMFAVKI